MRKETVPDWVDLINRGIAVGPEGREVLRKNLQRIIDIYDQDYGVFRGDVTPEEALWIESRANDFEEFITVLSFSDDGLLELRNNLQSILEDN